MPGKTEIWSRIEPESRHRCNPKRKATESFQLVDGPVSVVDGVKLSALHRSYTRHFHRTSSLWWSLGFFHSANRTLPSIVVLDRLRVPRPGVGYWIKKSHGKADARPILPQPQYGDETSVAIAPKQRDASANVVAPAPSIVVPKRLTKPHPLVQAAAEALGRARPDNYGRLGVPGTLAIRVGSNSLRRALRLMNAAIKTLERRGHGVVVRGERYREDTCAVIQGQYVSFALREPSRQRTHEPTAEKLRREKQYGRHWEPPYDYSPTGRLSLEIEGWLGDRGLRSRWRDSARRTVEDQLGDFIVGIEAVGDLHRRREEERKERERIEAEERARRKEEEERKRREAEREARLVEMASRWRSSGNLREFLLALEHHQPHVEGIEEVIVWGREVADRMDPLASPGAIAMSLARNSE